MRFGIRTLDDLDVKGKVVLCRVDFNQPVDRQANRLKSNARIRACIPTIRELQEKKAKIVLMAHQGSDIEYHNFYTTEPHSRELAALLGSPVQFVPDVCGPTAQERIRALKEGEILLLDNVRFVSEEQTLFELNLKLTHEQQAQTLLVRKLAPLGDFYVCDAFAAAHRDQPSLCGFEQVLPSAMGRLFEKEYCVISQVMEAPKRPCTFVLGGAKVSDAFQMMETVLHSGAADKVITGGLVANILLASQGVEIGAASMEFLRRSFCDAFIEKIRPVYAAYRDRIVLPEDVAYVKDGVRYEAPVGEIPPDAGVVDIGSQTAENDERIILSSSTVFVNGPMGVFEEIPSSLGTERVWKALGETGGYTVLGGGDSIAAAKQYDLMDRISYVCTGGGALIRFLSGEELPVVRALRESAKRAE